MSPDDGRGISSVPGEPEAFLDDHVELYALDTLGADECAEFERRLERADPPTRRRYRQRLAGIRETLARMSADVAEQPPAELRGRILAETGDPTRSARRSRWMPFLSAAAAVVLVAMGVVIGRATAPDSTRSAADQVSSQLATVLRASDAQIQRSVIQGTGAGVVVAASRSLNAAFVVISSAPQPPTGRAYQLWLMGTDHQPTSAGTMTHMEPTETAHLSRIDNSSQVAITVEPACGSLAPTGQPIVAVNL